MPQVAAKAVIPTLLIAVPGFSDAPSCMPRHQILESVSGAGLLPHDFVAHWQWIANLGEDVPAALLTLLGYVVVRSMPPRNDACSR